MVKEEELKEKVGYDYYDFKVSSDKNCKFCGWMTGVAMLMMLKCSLGMGNSAIFLVVSPTC